jgi:hypothetical protein
MGGWALRADRQALQVLCLFASRLVPKEVEPKSVGPKQVQK